MLLERVEAYIHKYHLIRPQDTVIVGFSGGPDSLCLSHLLWRLSAAYGWKLVLAHFDHQLRGRASAEDAEFCRSWAEARSLPFFMTAMDINHQARLHGESTELAARRCRYAFFRQVRLETGAERIALGHHQDDQAETVLMRLIRGTGVDGLGGMRPLREDGVIRPLLGTSRADILDYCKAEGLSPRTDHTNLEDIYTRNSLRLEVLPLLAARYNPRITEALCRTAALAAEDSDCLNALAEKSMEEIGKITETSVELPLDALHTMPSALVKRMLRHGVRELAGSAENLESEHMTQIMDLIMTPVTGKCVIFRGVRFTVAYGALVLDMPADSPEEPEVPLPFPEGTVRAFGGRFTARPLPVEEWRLSPRRGTNCVVIDADAVAGAVAISGRRPGDRLIPLGMNGFKKLKDLLIDLKVPRNSRDGIPVLRDAEKIIWVAGIRMDERVRVTDATENPVEITWEVCCSPD